MNLKQSLKQFGLTEFRPKQEDVIKSILAGKDTVLVAPTGLGKSLCFQLPAIMLPGITVVISPLISLMKDQVDALRGKGIGADFINSSITSEAEKRQIARRLHGGKTKLLYIAPERLSNQEFMNFIRGLNVSLIAIDEAHCISQWGHNFRPDYRLITRLWKIKQRVPVFATTATATYTVSDDICNQLELKEPSIFRLSNDRPNLYIEVVTACNRDRQLIDILDNNKHNGSTIIFCITRAETEKISNILSLSGYPAQSYHAGLNNEERQKMQEDFMSEKINIIVATSAFGMGIDKSNVRLVIHINIPKTMDSYCQEYGRAGRDEDYSKCYLIWDKSDINQWENIIRSSTKDSSGVVNYDDRRKQNKMLYEVVEYCKSDECRRKQILAYFQEDYEGNCRKCDVCLS